jgi:hypothetical protein
VGLMGDDTLHERALEVADPAMDKADLFLERR